ncbi:MAG: DUF1150 domain-containing protein [Neomegalonema sp.]|nr:DUF1150 domain-containing protein [Neomegalonema sp.]
MKEEATFDEFESQEPRLAYIRPVAKADIADAPDDAPEQLYALHDGDGRPLALFSSLSTAKVTARTHNFEPVTVH